MSYGALPAVFQGARDTTRRCFRLCGGQSAPGRSIFRASHPSVGQNMPRITPLELQGPAGLLEATLLEPERLPVFVATVAHPHPLYGGDMDNHVVDAAAQAAVELGGAALRFNFRGAGGQRGASRRGPVARSTTSPPANRNSAAASRGCRVSVSATPSAPSSRWRGFPKQMPPSIHPPACCSSRRP